MINTLLRVQAKIFKNDRCILNKQGPKLTSCWCCVSTLSNVPHFSPIPFFSVPGSQREKIAQRKQFKLPPHRDPIITRSRAREMSTSEPSTPEVNVTEFVQMKEQMAKMMCMMQ